MPRSISDDPKHVRSREKYRERADHEQEARSALSPEEVVRIKRAVAAYLNFPGNNVFLAMAAAIQAYGPPYEVGTEVDEDGIPYR